MDRHLVELGECHLLASGRGTLLGLGGARLDYRFGVGLVGDSAWHLWRCSLEFSTPRLAATCWRDISFWRPFVLRLLFARCHDNRKPERPRDFPLGSRPLCVGAWLVTAGIANRKAWNSGKCA